MFHFSNRNHEKSLYGITYNYSDLLRLFCTFHKLPTNTFPPSAAIIQRTKIFSLSTMGSHMLNMSLHVKIQSNHLAYYNLIWAIKVRFINAGYQQSVMLTILPFRDQHILAWFITRARLVSHIMCYCDIKNIIKVWRLYKHLFCL